MSTDLKTVRDHPANLLEMGNLNTVTSEVTAAEALRKYEAARGVTFAALDNEALARVREAYERVSTSGPGYKQDFAEVDLADAIRDLLGLGD